MKKLAIILTFALLAAPASAQFTPQATAIPGSVPEGINYQGRLEDGGFPVNATKSMVFRVYSALSGGVLLWTSPAQSVSVSLGLFNAVVPVPVTTLVGGGARYLEVQIDGTLMSPRELLNSVPYALIAKSVEGTIDVSTAGLAINANSAATQPAFYISSQTGNVGVGTGSPATSFDVGGSAQFGSGATKSTFTAAGALNTAGKITAPDYTATYGVSAATAAFGGVGTALGGIAQPVVVVTGTGDKSIAVQGGTGGVVETVLRSVLLRGQVGTTTDRQASFIQNGVEVMTVPPGGGYHASFVSGITASSVTSNGDALFRSNGFSATFSSGSAAGQDFGHITYGVGASDSFDLYGRPGKSLSLGANGAAVAYIKGTSFGIGSASPQSKMEVSGGNIQVAASGLNSAGIGFGAADGTSGWQCGQGLTANDGVLRCYDRANAYSPLVIERASAANSIYVKAGGNVGIGTGSPATSLDVNGNAQFGSGAAKSTFTAAGALAMGGDLTFSPDNTFSIGGGPAATRPSVVYTGYMMTGDGLVAAPSYRFNGGNAGIYRPNGLAVTNGASAGAHFTLTSGLSVGNITTAIGAETATLQVISTSTTAGHNVLRVDNNAGAALVVAQQSGRVGIGSTAPNDLLDVAGGNVRLTAVAGSAGSVKLFSALSAAATSCTTQCGANAACLAAWDSAGLISTCGTAALSNRCLCSGFGD